MIDLIEIITHDNIKLRGLHYFSKHEHKCLTVLSCSPYRNFENIKEIKSFGKFLSTIPAHYIYMDVRGTGESDGYAENEYSLNEINDTIEIIKYIRLQKWSNGNIMMHGISYSAFNALQACSITNGPDCLFIMHVSNNRWYNDIHYFGGIKTITEDINYSFATTGQHLLPCLRCIDTNLKIIKTPWFMKWFTQGCEKHIVWKNGIIDKLPPTFLICGWRDCYSSTAVMLSNIVTFTLIGPFGHNYPENHNLIIKKWINSIFNNNKININKINKYNKIKDYEGPICIVIPTPKSLWYLGYYQIKTLNNPNYKLIFESNKIINLVPDLVGDTLEIYTTGDPVLVPSLESVRKDLTRLPGWGYEYEILLDNYGIWGEPEIIFTCLKYEKGDYIVVRLVTAFGETLSVGVSRLKNGSIKIKLKPFFIPVNIYKIYLFLNRSWVPVLFPTTNTNDIKLSSIKLLLPVINDSYYVKLNIYPKKSETELLKDVTIKKIIKENNKLNYQTINKYSDNSFSEIVNLSFSLGCETNVNVENTYLSNNYNIKTITTINNNKTDIFDVKIIAYNNNELINNWHNSYIINNCD